MRLSLGGQRRGGLWRCMAPYRRSDSVLTETGLKPACWPTEKGAVGPALPLGGSCCRRGQLSVMDKPVQGTGARLVVVPFLGSSCPQWDLSQPTRAEQAPPVRPALSLASEEATGKM